MKRMLTALLFAIALPVYATNGGRPGTAPKPTPTPPPAVTVPITVQTPVTNSVNTHNNIHVHGGNQQQTTTVKANGGDATLNIGNGALSPSANAVIEKGAVENVNNNTLSSSSSAKSDSSSNARSDAQSASDSSVGDITIDAHQEAPRRVAPAAPAVSLAQPIPGYVATEGQKFPNVGSLHRDFNLAAMAGGGLGSYEKKAEEVGPALATLVYHSNFSVMKQGGDKPGIRQAFVGPKGTTDARRFNVLGTVMIQAKGDASARTVNFSLLKELLLDYVCEKFRGSGDIIVIFSFNDIVYTVGTQTTGKSTGFGGGLGSIIGLVTPTLNGGKSDTDSTVIPFASLGGTVYVVSAKAYRQDLGGVALSELFPPLEAR